MSSRPNHSAERSRGFFLSAMFASLESSASERPLRSQCSTANAGFGGGIMRRIQGEGRLRQCKKPR
jgi:hypothetical protein